MDYSQAYQPDRSLTGKLRRRFVRRLHRRPLSVAPGRPMISFSFDDAPLTAVETGAALLEAKGLRGTYYVSGGLAGVEAPMGVCARADDYRRLAAVGHEIACHTATHLDCGKASGSRALADVEANAVLLADWGADEVVSFAYPYGDVAGGPKGALASRYATLRGLHHGLISKGCDLNQTPAVGVEGPRGEALARRWMKRALARKAWLILYTHDVRPSPSPWGCTPETLGRLIEHAVDDGFEVVTVAQGARRLGLV